MSSPVRFVIFKEEDQWVAQCLEHDVCTQAPDLDTLHRRIRTTLKAEHDCLLGIGKAGIVSLPQAPARFFEMWGNRSKTFDRSGQTDDLAYELALVA